MTTEPTTDTPDAQAYAHWYDAAQTAQREVARLTAERDAARADASFAHSEGRQALDELGRVRAVAEQTEAKLDEVKRRARCAAQAIIEAIGSRGGPENVESAAERIIANRAALLALAEKAVSDRDTYRMGFEVENAEVARLTAALEDMRTGYREQEAERDRLRRELAEALAGREREYARAESARDLLIIATSDHCIEDEDDARGFAAALADDRAKWKEDAVALARQYARAEAEHDAAARIASEWSDIAARFQAVEPCPDCWGPKYLPEVTCVPCAHADEADDEARQMLGGAT